MREGAEVKLSKRAGSYVTLRDLIDWVGCDATRYFLVARAPTSQLTFDVDLALARSNENPVYYIQYAHARCASVLRKAQEANSSLEVSDGLAHLGCLSEAETLALAVTLGCFPLINANTVIFSLLLKLAFQLSLVHFVLNYMVLLYLIDQQK